MKAPTRRDLLAGVGTAVVGSVAGCNVFDRTDGPPRFEPSALDAILAAPAPDIERPTPVQPAAATIDAGLERCEELLATVPASISPDRIPNGVVRNEIESTREEAVDYREAVETAPDRFRALQTLQDARETAREAVTAYEAVTDELAADIEAERISVRTAVDTRLADVEYTGEEAQRTLLLAARIEDSLTTAQRHVQHGIRTADPNVLDVGEFAGEVEFADATLDTVEALTARHTERTAEAVDYRDRFETALESSMQSLRRADIPDPETTPEELVGEEVERMDTMFLLSDALRSVRNQPDRLERARDETKLATGLERAFAFERDLQAFDAVVQRVVDGEFSELETTEQIRSEREAVLDAADTVPVSHSEPSLAGDVFAQTLEHLQRTDREIQRYIERGHEAELSREYARYAHLRAQLEALPETIETMHTRLDIHG